MTKIDELNKLHQEVQAYKAANPGARVGYALNYGSILNAYREGDLSFSDAVAALNRVGQIDSTVSTQEQQRLRASFPLFTFTFNEGDGRSTVRLTPYSLIAFKPGHGIESRLTLEHLRLSLANSLMTLYPSLNISVWLDKDAGWLTCRIVDEAGRETGFTGQCSITDPNLHLRLKQMDDIARDALQPGFFLCTGHNRAEKIEDYDYLHFAGKYCKRYGEENPAHKKAAMNENYD